MGAILTYTAVSPLNLMNHPIIDTADERPSQGRSPFQNTRKLGLCGLGLRGRRHDGMTTWMPLLYTKEPGKPPPWPLAGPLRSPWPLAVALVKDILRHHMSFIFLCRARPNLFQDTRSAVPVIVVAELASAISPLVLPLPALPPPPECSPLTIPRSKGSTPFSYHRFHGGEGDGQVLEAKQKTSFVYF